MKYFDSCCEIGPRNDKDPAAPWSVTDVLRWMDHTGIDGALVSHTLSRKTDPLAARDRLAKAIKAAPGRLFPLWDVLPPDAGDAEPAPAEFLANLADADVRAVRFCPRSHAYPFHLDILGDLLAALEQARIPVFLEATEIPGDANGLYASLACLLKSYPDLPVVLQRAGWSMQRVITALMARYENLHLEFSSLQNNRGLEVYAARFGVHRLLFGTGLPERSAGALRAYVDYAQLSEADRAAIAGGNLSRLLGGLEPVAAPAREPDPLRDAAARGAVLPATRVLDAHCHLLPDGANSSGATVMYQGDARGMGEIQEIMGIKQTAVMSWSGPLGSDVDQGNEAVSAAVRRFPDQYLGVMYINPIHRSRDNLLAEMEQLVDREGFVGLKPYVRGGLRYNDPLYTPCWEFAEARALYVLCHTGGPAGDMDVMVDLAQTYPAVQWLVAHTGGSFSMARSVADAMLQCPNIWAEITLTAATNGVIEWLAETVGSDRILFGTDAPMRDPRPQFGWVVWADLPVADRRLILGENFNRILKMRRPPK